MSPTCFLVLTSLLFRRERRALYWCCVNPWGATVPLLIADCYASGSEEEDSLFRCR